MTSTTWVALLRGVNLGPRRKVAMADLRALLESLGYERVRTYLQSGNALFIGRQGHAEQLERRIASGIEADLGLEVRVLVRTAEEMARLVDGNPFVARGIDSKQLQAVFLSSPAPTRVLSQLDRKQFGPDEFEVGDRVIYGYLPNGLMGSRLPNWEHLLGLAATSRSWNTVSRLRALASGMK